MTREVLLAEINELPLAEQLALAEAITHSVREKLVSFPLPSTKANGLTPFFGVLSLEDGRAMSKAIDEGCEQVDVSEW